MFEEFNGLTTERKLLVIENAVAKYKEAYAKESSVSEDSRGLLQILDDENTAQENKFSAVVNYLKSFKDSLHFLYFFLVREIKDAMIPKQLTGAPIAEALEIFDDSHKETIINNALKSYDDRIFRGLYRSINSLELLKHLQDSQLTLQEKWEHLLEYTQDNNNRKRALCKCIEKAMEDCMPAAERIAAKRKTMIESIKAGQCDNVEVEFLQQGGDLKQKAKIFGHFNRPVSKDTEKVLLVTILPAVPYSVYVVVSALARGFFATATRNPQSAEVLSDLFTKLNNAAKVSDTTKESLIAAVLSEYKEGNCTSKSSSVLYQLLTQSDVLIPTKWNAIVDYMTELFEGSNVLKNNGKKLFCLIADQLNKFAQEATSSNAASSSSSSRSSALTMKP